ncbi:FAD-binding oxidoreductase, partial [Bacteroidia bacterium]|nr:FAD-binding oxidoreductase [Bacteroidia bacterium]
MPAGFYSIPVAKINRETKDAVSISFDIPSHLTGEFQYKAGQYLTFSKIINGEEVRRSYSLCSSPVSDSDYSVAVKQVDDGRMSTFLNTHLREGDVLDIMPPMGKFILEPKASASNHYFLFGGGSGITPLHSIIKTALVAEPNSKCYLVYANRDADSIIFKSELNALESKYSNLKVIHSLDTTSSDWSGLSGYLTKDAVSEIVRQELGLNYPVAQYYTCGPGPLMDVVVEGLKAIGVRDENVHTEYFTAKVKEDNPVSETAAAENYSDEVIERTIKVEVYGEQKEITVK